MPIEFAAMFERIRSRAQSRKPKRLESEWLRFEEPPQDAAKFIVSAFLENNEKARRLADEQIIPSLVRKRPVALSFVNVPVVTQSFVHALLYEALRVAWARQTPIFVTNAPSFVRSAVEYVQDYAQGG
jgi:hypothetical protein